MGVGDHQEERNVVILRLGNAVKIPLRVRRTALDCSAGMDQDRMVDGLLPAWTVGPFQPVSSVPVSAVQKP